MKYGNKLYEFLAPHIIMMMVILSGMPKSSLSVSVWELSRLFPMALLILEGNGLYVTLWIQ